MNSIDPETQHYRALSSQVTGSDVDVHRKMYNLMVATGDTPKQLVAREKEGIEALLRIHQVTGREELSKNPAQLAVRMLLAMKRLSNAFPLAGLPVVVDPTAPPAVSVMLLCEEPKRCVQERRDWVANFRAEMEEDDKDADGTSTSGSYVRFHRMYLAICNDLGLVNNEQFGTVSMFDPAVFGPVIREAQKRLTQAGVASMLSGVLRIARDLYADDSEYAKNLKAFESKVASFFPDEALSDDQIDEIVDFLDTPTAVVTLLNCHRAIEVRAEARRLRPLDRLGRRAAALSVKLKLDYVGLSTTHLAQLDVSKDFRGKTGQKQFRMPDPTKTCRWCWKDLEPEAERLLLAWMTARESVGQDSWLLFPGPEGKPRDTRVAMRLVYDEIEQVVGKRLKFTFIKDVACYAAIEANPERLEAIAEAAGYEDPRSLKRRMVVITRKRRRPGQ